MLNKELSINYLIKESTTLNSKSPLLLLLHGYGSNEADLHSFANYLPEHYTVVSIRAPHALPSGGFAWYNINFDNDMNKFNDHNQAKNSIKLIMKFLDELIEKYSIESNDISLLGFSQGTILSYALGLNFPERFKKIIGFSGYIDESMVFTNTNNLDYSNLKVYISHGTQDPVIPVDWARKSIEILKKEKINHNYKEFVSGHTISPDNFYDFKSWLDTSN